MAVPFVAARMDRSQGPDGPRPAAGAESSLRGAGRSAPGCRAVRVCAEVATFANDTCI